MPFTMSFGAGFEGGTFPVVPAMYGGVAPGVDNVNPHNGTYSFRCGHQIGTTWINFPTPAVSDVYFGAWHYAGNGFNGNHSTGFGFHFTDGSRIVVAQAYKAYNIYSISGETWNVMAYGPWQIPSALARWVNVQVHYIASGSGTIDVKIDGITYITYSGDTIPGSSSILSYVQFFGTGWISWNYFDTVDDVAVGTGGWPGDVRFDAIFPNGKGTVSEWRRNGISEQSDPAAPSVSLGASGTLNGNYRYRVTLVDPNGETYGGTISSLISPSFQKVELTSIPVGDQSTTARKIYRTVAGGAVYKLLATISDNTTTTYSDDIGDGSLGAEEPSHDTNWMAVDENPPNDNDYAYAFTDGDQDLYTLSDWNGAGKTPLAVTIWDRVKKDTADSQQAMTLMKSGTVYDTSAAFDVYSDPTYIYKTYMTNPEDAQAWEDCDIDALEIGIEYKAPS